MFLSLRRHDPDQVRRVSAPQSCWASGVSAPCRGTPWKRRLFAADLVRVKAKGPEIDARVCVHLGRRMRRSLANRTPVPARKAYALFVRERLVRLSYYYACAVELSAKVGLNLRTLVMVVSMPQGACWMGSDKPIPRSESTDRAVVKEPLTRRQTVLPGMSGAEADKLCDGKPDRTRRLRIGLWDSSPACPNAGPAGSGPWRRKMSTWNAHGR
jgi:hypothetical protein